MILRNICLVIYQWNYATENSLKVYFVIKNLIILENLTKYERVQVKFSTILFYFAWMFTWYNYIEKTGNFFEQKSSLPIQVLFFFPQYWDRTVGRLWEVLGWDTEGCSELTIVTTISCCFLIELQQLKLSAAWPGIKLTGFENIFLITSLYINLNFQF